MADTLSRQQADRESLKFVFFDGEPSRINENVAEAKECVRKMLNRGHEICYICDPYFNVDDFVNYVFFVTNLGVDIRIINCKDALSDNAAESLRSSFSEFGHRTTTISQIPDTNKKQILAQIKAWWKDDSKTDPLV